jgi:enoyl-CoA hydratase
MGVGLEIALLCDILIVSDDAKLFLSEIKAGLIAASGGSVKLARSVGKYKAM